MPRYFFHIRDGASRIDDLEGQDFVDVEAAREEAMAGAVDILRNAVSNGKAGSLNQAIEVMDDLGATVLVVPIGRVTGTPAQT